MKFDTTHFDQSFEDRITTRLKNYLSQFLKFAGIGEFNDRGKLLRLRKVSKVGVSRDGIEESGKSITTHESIWEFVDEITEDVPEEHWASLPKDLAESHDDYMS